MRAGPASSGQPGLQSETLLGGGTGAGNRCGLPAFCSLHTSSWPSERPASLRSCRPWSREGPHPLQRRHRAVFKLYCSQLCSSASVHSEDKARPKPQAIHWRPHWRSRPLWLPWAFLRQGLEGTQSLEKVTFLGSFFSMAAWTDFMMSWVCSMLMFQVAM